MLKVSPEAGQIRAPLPLFTAPTSLVSVAAHEFGIFLLNVAKTWHVDSIWPAAERHLVFIAIQSRSRSAAHDVIHHVVAEFSTRVSQSVGKFRCSRVEKNPCRFQCRRAQEDYLRM